MTLFEYLSVAVSILLSLGMVHILSRIKGVLEGGRSYWIHTVHVGLILLLHPVYWWMFWGYRDVSWTLPFFLMALVPPSLICVLATSLVPSDSSAIASWRDHYFRIHRSFFGLYVAFTVAVATQTVLLRGDPILDASRSFQSIVFAMFIVATLSSRVRVHAVVALALIAVTVVTSATTLLSPVTPTRVP